MSKHWVKNMPQENALCVVPGFGRIIETSKRIVERTWNDRGANANDVHVTYVFDQYTGYEWVVDRVRGEINDFAAKFKTNNYNNISQDHTGLGEFRKTIKAWLENANFNDGLLLAKVEIVLSVDVKRTSTTNVSYSLAFCFNYGTMPNETATLPTNKTEE